VPGNRQPDVIARHPAAIITDPYQVLTALLHLNSNIG